MYTIYHLKADELDNAFLENLKSAFKDKYIEISVSESDETEYLLRSNANRAHLIAAVQDVENGDNVIPLDQKPFNEKRSFS